ncbi:MAG TPA: hypothetical protein VGS19_33170, partial [Streptosporangiaceae bacterium]|nr:hypothetical protein [Streptosporangiaceae bacterium]
MIIKSLAELREADERTLRFNPLGLGGRMRPEDSAEFQQQVIARYELVEAVAEGTRHSFDQLREILSYGVLCYDIFTVIKDHALLVLEQALRDRFMQFHRGTVSFVDPRTGKPEELTADRYEQVHEFLNRNRNRKLKLRLGDGPETMTFNGTLGGLREWARSMGFLRGQRNRAIEAAIARLRNYVAHPSSYHLTTPVDAANTISDLAEIINHLWGSPTPGGRLYPAPVQRTIIHLMWNEETSEVMSGIAAPGTAPAEQDSEGAGGEEQSADIESYEDQAQDGWTHLLVRGVPHDWDLMHFDARYDTGRYPAEWLWGPGTGQEAMRWLASEQPSDDAVDTLDRFFLLRCLAPILYVPKSPDQAASVTDDEKSGTWYLIRADSPEQAFNHQRQFLAGGFGCAATGPCPRCPVQTAGAGSWDEAMALL